MDLIPSRLMNMTLESYLIRIDTRSRIIYWIIIVMVICSLLLLPLIYMDVAVRTRGYFQSETLKQIIYTPVQGRVSFSSIVLGGRVNKGDTLLKFDTRPERALLNATETRLAENNSAISDLGKLISTEDPGELLTSRSFLTGRYYSEYLNLRQAWLQQLRKYEKIRAEHERNELFYHQELIPDIDYESSLFEFTTERDALGQILISQKSIWQADLMARKLESGSLMAEIRKCREELNNKVILAPVSGEIIQSADLQPGSLVAINQTIAEISPNGDLLAICFVDTRDIGFLKKDQQVKIQVDALNHTTWGLLNASIMDISDDMISEKPSAYYFRVRCKPDYTYLTLKNGIRADLKKGMSFSARIKVTRRSVFNLIFDKIDMWVNPYIIKPDQKS